MAAFGSPRSWFRPYRLFVVAGVLLNAGCVAVLGGLRVTDVGGPFGSVEPQSASRTCSPRSSGPSPSSPGSSRSLDGTRSCASSTFRDQRRVPARARARGPRRRLRATPMARRAHDDGTVAVATGSEHADTRAAAGPIGAWHATAAGRPRPARSSPSTIPSHHTPANTCEDVARREARLALAFFDDAAVVAAGYHSIGDGRLRARSNTSSTTRYMDDDHELDPHAIESIVLGTCRIDRRRSPGGVHPRPGPDARRCTRHRRHAHAVADHQNLCWDDAGQSSGFSSRHVPAGRNVPRDVADDARVAREHAVRTVRGDRRSRRRRLRPHPHRVVVGRVDERRRVSPGVGDGAGVGDHRAARSPASAQLKLVPGGTISSMRSSRSCVEHHVGARRAGS